MRNVPVTSRHLHGMPQDDALPRPGWLKNCPPPPSPFAPLAPPPPADPVLPDFPAVRTGTGERQVRPQHGRDRPPPVPGWVVNCMAAQRAAELPAAPEPPPVVKVAPPPAAPVAVIEAVAPRQRTPKAARQEKPEPPPAAPPTRKRGRPPKARVAATA